MANVEAKATAIYIVKFYVSQHKTCKDAGKQSLSSNCITTNINILCKLYTLSTYITHGSSLAKQRTDDGLHSVTAIYSPLPRFAKTILWSEYVSHFFSLTSLTP